jgi:hypothetical protein
VLLGRNRRCWMDWPLANQWGKEQRLLVLLVTKKAQEELLLQAPSQHCCQSCSCPSLLLPGKSSRTWLSVLLLLKSNLLVWDLTCCLLPLPKGN